LSYQIATYGNKVLREKSRRVEAVTDGIREIVKEMLSTMYSNNGLGLAAEQVGRDEALCIVDVPDKYEKESDAGDPQGNPGVEMPLVLINPVITASEGEITAEEGCLSFPGIYTPVKRFAKVTVSYMNLDGETVDVSVRGLLARAVQHELDHLDGVLLVDRMSPVRKVALSGRLKRLRKKGAAQQD
jgi:peptide deformylase